MNARTAFPPSHHHATKQISPLEAQQILAAYLAKTPTTAYLHPDAILSQAGIQFPAQSGPEGGLALHHLRRVDAGLRGENLIAETQEELKALFAPAADELPAGDDARLDSLTGGRKQKKKHDSERIGMWQDAQDPEEYAHQQTEMDEEFGAHIPQGTGVGEQVDEVPELKQSSKIDKRARKQAKRDRNKLKKAELAAGS